MAAISVIVFVGVGCDAQEGEREAVDVRPRVAADLLVFVRGSDFPEVDLILKWAALPPMPAD